MLYNDVDFRNGSDTGEPEAAAIQPYNDGEPAGQGIFRRPVENTRSRSDLLRQVLREHLVLRDLQQVLLVGGGTFTFGGAKPTYTGVFTTTADLEVRPFATPGADASPYTVSTKASVLVGSVDVIKFESKYKQWQDPGADPDIAAEADMISVEIVHTGVLSVAVQGAAGQQNNVYVTINYGTTTCQEVIDAVNVHTGANKLVVASLASGTNTNPASKFSTAEWGSDWSVRFLRGGAPGLLHVITSAVLATFFAAHVDNPLRKGDTLAIWYDQLIELSPVAPPPGGRLQSTPENSNYSIPAGSLFNTRREPEKIPNCVPICKCVDDNTIIFVDGSRITRTTAATLWWDSAHLVGGSSSLISISGWARLHTTPCPHVPPTTVQDALDNADKLFDVALDEIEAARGGETDLLTNISKRIPRAGATDISGALISNNSSDLGGSSTRWGTAYANNLNFDTDLTPGASAKVNGHLIPKTDNADDLGDGTYGWRNFYIKGNIVGGVNSRFAGSVWSPNSDGLINMGSGVAKWGIGYFANLKSYLATPAADEDVIRLATYREGAQRVADAGLSVADDTYVSLVAADWNASSVDKFDHGSYISGDGIALPADNRRWKISLLVAWLGAAPGADYFFSAAVRFAGALTLMSVVIPPANGGYGVTLYVSKIIKAAAAGELTVRLRQKSGASNTATNVVLSAIPTLY
jgi:hypothetical protein